MSKIDVEVGEVIEVIEFFKKLGCFKNFARWLLNSFHLNEINMIHVACESFTDSTM
jgi:hypothetical protein